MLSVALTWLYLTKMAILDMANDDHVNFSFLRKHLSLLGMFPGFGGSLF